VYLTDETGTGCSVVETAGGVDVDPIDGGNACEGSDVAA
jgi:hypothetical protein